MKGNKLIIFKLFVLFLISCTSDDNNSNQATTQDVLKLIRVDFLDQNGNIDSSVRYEYNQNQTLDKRIFVSNNMMETEYEFIYNNQGQLISDGIFNFEYSNNLISRATTGSGMTSFSYEYQYNSSNQVIQYSQILGNVTMCSTNVITFDVNENSIFQDGCWNYNANYDDNINPFSLVYPSEYLKINAASEVFNTALFIGNNNIIEYNTNDSNVMDSYSYTYNNMGYPLTRDYQGTGYDFLLERKSTIFIYETLTFPN